MFHWTLIVLYLENLTRGHGSWYFYGGHTLCNGPLAARSGLKTSGANETTNRSQQHIHL